MDKFSTFDKWPFSVVCRVSKKEKPQPMKLGPWERASLVVLVALDEVIDQKQRDQHVDRHEADQDRDQLHLLLLVETVSIGVWSISRESAGGRRLRRAQKAFQPASTMRPRAPSAVPVGPLARPVMSLVLIFGLVIVRERV